MGPLKKGRRGTNSQASAVNSGEGHHQHCCQLQVPAHHTVGHSPRVELWKNLECLRTHQETRQFLQNTELFLDYVSVLHPGIADRSALLSAVVFIRLYGNMFLHVWLVLVIEHITHVSPSLFSHHIYWLNYSSSSNIISCLALLILSARMRDQEQRFGYFLNPTFH